MTDRIVARGGPVSKAPAPPNMNKVKQSLSSGPQIAGLDYPHPDVRTDPSTGEVLPSLPHCDPTNPADLESWYGPFSFFDHYRKIVLADAKEIIRAKSVAGAKQGDKAITEARIEDLSRTSDLYVNFLELHLAGRRLREQNVIDSNRNGA
jgi:hypothetical protein